MHAYLPLDDQLNHLFYNDGAIGRLVWDRPLGRCVLRREAIHLDFEQAITLIGSGELLWLPPESFEPLDVDSSPDDVQQEDALLYAFLRSPLGLGVSWRTRRRLVTRLNDIRAWLAHRALTRGDTDQSDDEGC
jgi:hypothetical protein